MPNTALIVNAQMRALVQRFGCLDAAAAAIQAATGTSTGKGTLTKRMSGQLEWPVEQVAALEDAIGDYPITRMLARRIAGDAVPGGLPLTIGCGVASKEGGEAIAAALKAEVALSSANIAEALVEVREAIDAYLTLENVLLGKLSEQHTRKEMF